MSEEFTINIPEDFELKLKKVQEQFKLTEEKAEKFRKSIVETYDKAIKLQDMAFEILVRKAFYMITNPIMFNSGVLMFGILLEYFDKDRIWVYVEKLVGEIKDE